MARLRCAVVSVKTVRASAVKDGERRGSRRRRLDAQRVSTWSSQYSIHALVRQGEDRLILRATNLVRGIAIAFVAFGAAIFWGRVETSIFDPAKARDAATLMGSLLILLGCAMWLAPQRVVFDRRRGRVSRRYWLWRFQYAWQEIIAVQITHGGWDQELDSSPTPRGTRELKLVLDSSYAPRVPLTNHADDRTTDAMAADIARFLKVPLWDELEHEVCLDAVAESTSVSDSVAGAWMTRLGWLSAASYVVALGSLFFALALSIDQRRWEELDASAVPIRARLVAMETKEWIQGHNNWYARGLFDIESADYQGRAEGNLIPESFYSQHHLRGRGSRNNKVPQPVAARFLFAWEIGETYDGYLYPDVPNHIFFELRDAQANAFAIRRLFVAAGGCFLLGVLVSTAIGNLKRRPLSEHTLPPK
jgi:hypothetical protein